MKLHSLIGKILALLWIAFPATVAVAGMVQGKILAPKNAGDFNLAGTHVYLKELTFFDDNGAVAGVELNAEARTRYDGSFKMPDELPAGHFTLLVRKAGKTLGTVDVVIPEGTEPVAVDIQLPEIPQVVARKQRPVLASPVPLP